MTTPINGGPLPPPKQIRFVNNQGQPPTKRRRINAACLTCRKRKTRCAGERPKCSTCTKNGHACLGYSDVAEKLKDNTNAHSRPAPAYHLDDGGEDDNEEDSDSDGDGDEHRRRKKSGRSGHPYPFVKPEVAHATRRASESNVSNLAITFPQGRRDSVTEWDRDCQRSNLGMVSERTSSRHAYFSEDTSGSSAPRPSRQIHTESHRVPYFRYFGPTAIVPGFKQMVVSVKDRQRSTGTVHLEASPSSLSGLGPGFRRTAQTESGSDNLQDLPVYDPNDPSPVPPLIEELVKTFFVHLGCNYPFLQEQKFIRLVREKLVEPILVDTVCALAARFSDLPVFTNLGQGKLAKSDYGQVFFQRAKAQVFDTYACPSVGAVQAMLLLAYERFGANQDSALWMMLGNAIRMAIDLGLQKVVGVKYQGEKDPWYTRTTRRISDEGIVKEEANEDTLSPEEQKEVEQERIDTFWAVFALDRVVSVGTGRPVSFKDEDFEHLLPRSSTQPDPGWPDPFPTFLRIILLYGRVSDTLNRMKDPKELTEDVKNWLSQKESELTRIYHQNTRLHFNVENFRQYVQMGQGPTFILMHFWFHAIIITLHQPSLHPSFGSFSRVNQLLLAPGSHELSMSSAKTIADILAFAELVDPMSFIGNPFTSQPMYIAACAFLMESVVNASQPPSRDATPPREARLKATESGSSKAPKHLLLVSAANTNYQRCYKSLQQLHAYWGGVKYILTALDQRSAGIWDCETYTWEEYESTKLGRRGSDNRLDYSDNHESPNDFSVAYSMTGTMNSPNPSVTRLLFQNMARTTPQPQLIHSVPTPASAPTPPGNMIYDPIRQSLPEPVSMFPPAFPQPATSAIRHSARRSKAHRLSTSSIGSARTQGSNVTPHMKFNSSISEDMSMSPDVKLHILGAISGPGASQALNAYSPSSHHSSAFETRVLPTSTVGSTMNEAIQHSGHSAHHRPHNYHSQHQHTPRHDNCGPGHDSNPAINTTNGHGPDFAQSGLTSGSYACIEAGGPPNDIISFDSQEVDINSLAYPNEIMPGWLNSYLPGDVIGLFEEGAGTGAG